MEGKGRQLTGCLADAFIRYAAEGPCARNIGEKRVRANSRCRRSSSIYTWRISSLRKSALIGGAVYDSDCVLSVFSLLVTVGSISFYLPSVSFESPDNTEVQLWRRHIPICLKHDAIVRPRAHKRARGPRTQDIIECWNEYPEEEHVWLGAHSPPEANSSQRRF